MGAPSAPTAVFWKEPGLFDATGSRLSLEASDGLAFAGTVHGGPGPVVLSELVWISQAGAQRTLTLDANQWVRGHTEPGAPGEWVEDNARIFAQRVSAASEEAREAWVEGYLASQFSEVTSTRYEMALPGPLRLEALFVETGASAAFVDDGPSRPGFVERYGQEGPGTWRFQFLLPVLEAHGNGAQVRVDSWDRAWHWEDLGAMSDVQYLEKVADRWVEWGLPRPALTGAEVYRPITYC